MVLCREFNKEFGYHIRFVYKTGGVGPSWIDYAVAGCVI